VSIEVDVEFVVLSTMSQLVVVSVVNARGRTQTSSEILTSYVQLQALPAVVGAGAEVELDVEVELKANAELDVELELELELEPEIELELELELELEMELKADVDVEELVVDRAVETLAYNATSPY
jgi:hypothetical protein